MSAFPSASHGPVPPVNRYGVRCTTPVHHGARGETLPLETFRFFLEQDNFYLEENARCLAMGAAKSRTEAEPRYFTTDLNQA